MLIISRKKRRFARILFWGSFILEVIAACFVAFPDERSTLSVLCLFGLMIPLFTGSSMLDKLYRCPKCCSKLLAVGTRMDNILEKLPKHCPHCGHKIEVKYE